MLPRLWSALLLSGNPGTRARRGHASRGQQASRTTVLRVVTNAKNLDALDELLVPDGVDHTFGSENAEQANQFFGMVHQAFPDLHAEVHDVITEGSRWLLGNLYRHPPGRVRRHPRDREADDHQRGRSVRDAGRQAGRTLGRAGHVQLPTPAEGSCPAEAGRDRARRPSDLWSPACGRLCQVSRGPGEAGAGGVVVDLAGDGGQCGAQVGGAWGWSAAVSGTSSRWESLV
jgi:hypothetical protein